MDLRTTRAHQAPKVERYAQYRNHGPFLALAIYVTAIGVGLHGRLDCIRQPHRTIGLLIHLDRDSSRKCCEPEGPALTYRLKPAFVDLFPSDDDRVGKALGSFTFPVGRI